MRPRFLLIGVVLAAAGNQSRFKFEDVTAKAGIHFFAENGTSPQKTMIETMRLRVGVLDYDGDGRLDIVSSVEEEGLAL